MGWRLMGNRGVCGVHPRCLAQFVPFRYPLAAAVCHRGPCWRLLYKPGRESSILFESDLWSNRARRWCCGIPQCFTGGRSNSLELWEERIEVCLSLVGERCVTFTLAGPKTEVNLSGETQLPGLAETSKLLWKHVFFIVFDCKCSSFVKRVQDRFQIHLRSQIRCWRIQILLFYFSS